MKIDRQNKIAILGFGVEGRAIFKYFSSKKYSNITICDANKNLVVPPEVNGIVGEHYLDSLNSFDYIFRSPGIKFLNKKIQSAKTAGVKITSATKFFLENCPCRIIGVSGTKGKGTTSTLIYEILKNNKEDVYLGGNIGDPAINFLDKLTHESIVVLELSSFQLQDLETSPHVSVLLNTTEDHLDWHVDKAEYWQAKESIIKFQDKDDLAILNFDYPYIEHYKKLTSANVKLVSSGNKTGDVYQSGGIIFSKNEEIISVSDIGLLGKHNWENVMPAIVVAQKFQVNKSIIADTIAEFKGLEYRLELIATIEQVSFYNDSFSTNPATSIAGVQSFSEPLTLIAGGYDKGLDYSIWAKEIAQNKNVKSVCLIGDLAPKLNNLLKSRGFTRIHIGLTMEVAVEKAYRELVEYQSGIVLLSPAAASFDMFENYKDRGQKFIAAVSRLK